MKTKGEAYDVIKWFTNLVKVHHAPHRILEIMLDGGLEFGGQKLKDLAQQEVITLRKSSAYTPEQNGTAESSNKVIFTRARAMMIDSGLPQNLWPEAVDTAIYITNRTSTGREAVPPRAQLIKNLTGQTETIDISNLRRFGCVAYLHIPTERRLKSGKFNIRAVRGYCVGYQQGGHTNYRIWIPETNMIKESPHVTFDESKNYANSYKKDEQVAKIAPYLFDEKREDRYNSDSASDSEQDGRAATYPQERAGRQQPQQDVTDDSETDDDTIVVAPYRSHQSTVTDRRQGDSTEEDHIDDQDELALDYHEDAGTAGTADPEDAHTEITNAQGVQDTQTHRTTRQSTRGERKTYGQYRTSFGPYAQYAYAMMTIESNPHLQEPRTYEEALTSPECSQWQASMKREVQQLENQGAWKLVAELPPGRKLIKGRWVYKKKLNTNNTIKEYKSRWVAKGFMQQEGVDYLDTYAATLFSTTFRVIFSIAASRGWKLYQMDVTGAFLHSVLTNEIYMEAPHGYYVNNKICRVLKSIYGLKQAPHLWFESISGALHKLGFSSLQSDACCFTNQAQDVFVMVFVDDIQITGSNDHDIRILQTGLRNEFTMKDVEPQTYLGLQIERKGNSLRLHQAPYTQKVLESFGFDKAKSVPTPMVDRPLSLHEEEPNETLRQTYLRAIGSLLFLANRTRPDIEYPVNFLARFSSNPSSEHWNAIKRIFRYLVGTINLGIQYQARPDEPFLFGFSDSDYAGDLDHRKSTSGYLFILGGGPVSWKSRLQRTVTLSSTEAEYAALTEATREANWLQQLLTELGTTSSSIRPILIYEDNMSTISLALNHSNHKRSKHIDVKNHYCREQVVIGNIDVKYIRTDEQAADGFTKPLGPQKWKTFQDQLRLTEDLNTS
jgi:hypothetical protein